MNKFTYQEAFEESKKYFNGNELAANVFVTKYALVNDKDELLENSPNQMFKRLAREYHRIESSKFKKPLAEEEICNLFDNFRYIVPQGGILSGVGNKYQITSNSNCFSLPQPVDSYGGILKSDQELAQVSKRRGGVGFSLSSIRPKDSPTTNSSKTSTGIIPFLKRFSNTMREVGQGGRRAAGMFMLNVHHPDILDFISSKKDETQITGGNISVQLTDEFLDAVEKDKEYELRFPVDSNKPLISKKIIAKKVWKEIIHNAWDMGEPGLLFWDKITSYNASDCYAALGYKTTGTNACSELPMADYGQCLLMAMNLFSYVKNPFTKNAEFDFELYSKHVKSAIRLMDDTVDLELEKINTIIDKINKDPESEEIKAIELNLWKQIHAKCKESRRVGLGITALADCLAALGLAYGSNDSIKMTDKIFYNHKHSSYTSSVELAKELKPFPIWSWDYDKNSLFLKQIEKEDKNLYNDIKKYGRRNIGCITVAPTGSISILTQTTSGIEPCYQLSYIRRKKLNGDEKNIKVDFVDANGDKWQEFKVIHSKLNHWMQATGETDINKSPWICADDVNWKARIELQAAAAKHIDHSLSSTVNLPNNVAEAKVAEIYETAWKSGLKGITVYRKGSRSGVLVDKPSENKINKTKAPKRPNKLKCNVHHLKVGSQAYVVVVGLLNNEPYEVFAEKNGAITKDKQAGFITKIKRGHYSISGEEGEIVIKDTQSFLTPEHAAITRLISLSLRHGGSIEFICEQLEKSKGDILSFSKALVRVLKQYIPDGTKVHGDCCPECKADLIRENGCVKCTCGFSKCS